MKEKMGSKEIRDQVAAKVRRLRVGERETVPDREPFYTINRDKEKYLEKLMGYVAFLDYVKTLPSNIVLDIGAGTTRAISEIAKSKAGAGLDFKATALNRNPDIEKNLGFENVHVTSVETLRGVADQSIGGVTAVFSLPYVVDPALAVKSIDRVLVPGGVVKAWLPSTESNDEKRIIKGNTYRSYHEFEAEFKKLGYDCEYLERDGLILEVFLAIKPGGRPGGPSAQELVSVDVQTRFDRELNK
ncbi:methyltransferase domain-containing protein [Candidatus Kaiserbacteria bacterium]|nr:methyltransferase domain-containing protein [Candidatus Kaiserbacteria bacterium]